MHFIHRRDAVKLVAGMAIGTVAVPAVAQELPGSFAVAAKAKDEALASAVKNLPMYMFSEEVVIQLEGDRYSRDLVITSARDEEGRSVSVHVRSASLRVFRADDDQDEFTRQGGLYWKFHGKQGKVQFKRPGALVMVLRDHLDNARFYTLTPDYRC